MTSIKTDYDFYKSKHQELQREHPNSVVVIKDKEIEGYYNSREEALIAASKRFELGTFIVQEIEEDINEPRFIIPRFFQ